MATFDHVNVGVPEGGAEPESRFLIEVIGLRRVQPGAEFGDFGELWWFEADDGSQVHLSIDPDHRPAAKAHVALRLGDDITDVERRLSEAGRRFRAVDFAGRRIVFAKDPAGNRWELSGPSPAA